MSEQEKKQQLQFVVDKMLIGCSDPHPGEFEVVKVYVSDDIVLGQYAEQFVRAIQRSDIELQNSVGLTVDEVREYAKFLIKHRCDYCSPQGDKDHKLLRKLWVPWYLQFVMRMIGNVTIYSKGLRFEPIAHPDMQVISVEEALVISDKIGMFRESRKMFQDAMERSDEGDPDVMTTVLLANQVASIEKLRHPTLSYISAFLNFRLVSESSYRAMYRFFYDDVGFIADALARADGVV